MHPAAPIGVPGIFFFLNLMLVTGSRLPISAPCTHLRNKPCTGDNTGGALLADDHQFYGLQLPLQVIGAPAKRPSAPHGAQVALSQLQTPTTPRVHAPTRLFTTQFVPNRDATPTSWRRANDSGRHPIPVGAVVVHRQSGDKPGQLRFRHCGSGGHRIRKRTHGARTVRARFRQHPHGVRCFWILGCSTESAVRARRQNWACRGT